MKKIISMLLCVFTLLSLSACSSNEVISTDTVYAQITMEDGGVITLELYADVAPITVSNFVKLANDGVYDGTIFHRVIKNFMIQGGYPTGTGYGDSSISKIKGEFSSNGVKNDISHTRGVISMARSEKNDSASSQFFICHADSTYLDGKYAAFGKVIAGMDVVDKIASVATDSNDRPTTEQKIKTVRIIDEEKANAAVSDISSDSNTSSAADTSSETGDESSVQLSASAFAQITMEDGGVITLELYADVAPITVSNFIKLAKDGVYDGTIFHRVIKDFMIQGGDPTGTGYGDPSLDTITGEFSANGVENILSHHRGVISMARSEKYDSASSQFFICHADSTYLDGKYAAFGKVIAGMDVVDKIASVTTGSNNRPITEQKIKTIRIIDEEEANAAANAEKSNG